MLLSTAVISPKYSLSHSMQFIPLTVLDRFSRRRSVRPSTIICTRYEQLRIVQYTWKTYNNIIFLGINN